MIKSALTAVVLLAVTATGAAAVGLPGKSAGGPESVVVRVVSPAPVAKRGVAVQRRTPVISRRVSPPVSAKKFVPQSAARKFTPPLAAKKFTSPPVAMRKMPPPLAKGKPIVRMPAQFVHVKPHRKRKHYGRVFGGVVLGSILAASAFYAYSSPPEDGLCWYWTNSSRERGYWDYCEPPEDD